jgi:hypothetical protein
MALNAKANPNYVPKRINGKFAPGYSGNPGGSLEATRRSFNKDFLLALAADFKRHGPEAIAKVRKQQPAAYMKICALLVPREMKVEHSGGVKAMSDEQLEAAIELIKEMLAQQAKVIEGTAETVALPAPDVVPDGPNKVMDAADTAMGARERTPRKRKAPSPTGG